MIDKKTETDEHGVNWVIFGLADRYKVSESGDVMSRIVSIPKRKVKGVNVFRGWRPLKAMFKRNDYTGAGYLKVSVKLKPKGHEHVCIHKLVAGSFIEKVNGKNFINHIDGNRLNNKFSNLEWCTHQENIDNAKERGAFLWENSPERVLDDAQMLTAISLLNAGFGAGLVAKHYNVSSVAFFSAKKGIDFSYKCFRGLIDKSVKTKPGKSLSSAKRESVLGIREMYRKENTSLSQIALAFGVSKSQVFSIVQNKSWKNI